MDMFRTLRTATFAGAVATLALLVGCGGASSSGSAPSGNGTVNLAITDAPSDSWQQVSVVLESASLVAQGSSTPVPIWTASTTNPNAGVVNLVDLNSVATLLGTVTVATGTYSQLQLVINPDPTTMTLVDDNGNTIPAADITVKGNGTITVDLAPALTVPASGTATLQADFNLADPLSIVETTLGGVTQVVLDLQVRHKAVPANLRSLQFARKLGVVSAPTATGFTITDSSSNSFTYIVDANTIYFDADAKKAGTLAGLTAGKYALVASNLNADGTLYARRVWYAASAATLPAWTPEGLVRRVRPDQDSFTIYTKNTNATNTQHAWVPQNVQVDANTAWTFHDTVTMGTGTGFLADIWRGCRVDVQLNAAGTTATSINVQSAYDEGFIGATSATSVTFGWSAMAPPPMAGGVTCGINDMSGRTWTYYQNPADPTNAFSWWYFGLPSSTDAAPADLTAVVTAAKGAKLPVTATANLFWDTVSSSWQAYQLVLEPEQLRTSVITTGYKDGGSGSGTLGVTCLSPFNDWNTATAPTAMTVTLDYTGDLQTLVESATYTRATRTFTFIAPVPASDWATLLQPAATATMSFDQVWVRPVLNGTAIDWHAYTVQQFTAQ